MASLSCDFLKQRKQVLWLQAGSGWGVSCKDPVSTTEPCGLGGWRTSTALSVKLALVGWMSAGWGQAQMAGPVPNSWVSGCADVTPVFMYWWPREGRGRAFQRESGCNPEEKCIKRELKEGETNKNTCRQCKEIYLREKAGESSGSVSAKTTESSCGLQGSEWTVVRESVRSPSQLSLGGVQGLGAVQRGRKGKLKGERSLHPKYTTDYHKGEKTKDNLVILFLTQYSTA